MKKIVCLALVILLCSPLIYGCDFYGEPPGDNTSFCESILGDSSPSDINAESIFEGN